MHLPDRVRLALGRLSSRRADPDRRSDHEIEASLARLDEILLELRRSLTDGLASRRSVEARRDELRADGVNDPSGTVAARLARLDAELANLDELVETLQAAEADLHQRSVDLRARQVALDARRTQAKAMTTLVQATREAESRAIDTREATRELQARVAVLEDADLLPSRSSHGMTSD